MKSLTFVGIFFFVRLFVSGQSIEILRQSDQTIISENRDFAFIEPTTNISELEFVATIKITGENQLASIDGLFFKVKEKAHELGANSFKLIDYELNENPHQTVLTFDIYNGNDSILNVNFANHEKNVIYIFGSDNYNSEASTFKLNDDKKEIFPRTYYRHENNEGEEVKIAKGGFLGMTMWIKWKENKPATFLTLSGFGLGSGGVPVETGGIAFNTGRLNYIDGNLGHMLIQLFQEQK